MFPANGDRKVLSISWTRAEDFSSVTVTEYFPVKNKFVSEIPAHHRAEFKRNWESGDLPRFSSWLSWGVPAHYTGKSKDVAGGF